MNSSALYIGIDLGTSGVRACAINDNSDLLHTSKTTLPTPLIKNNGVTQDAHLWWLAVETTLLNLCKNINSQHVVAICVNGTSGTVLVCDAEGEPLAPARLYNDNFCSEQAALIQKVAPLNSAAHGTSSGLAKLLYLQQHYPQAVYCLHQADWIVGKLCEHFNFSDENNALKSGYDLEKNAWPAWLNKLNVNIKSLPDVFTPGSVLAPISQNIISKYQLNSNCKIISGTTDSIAAFIASGANKPGDAVTSLGSTLVLKMITEQAIYAPESGIYSHRLGDYWLAGGASNTGGAVLAHYFNSQQIKQFSDLIHPEKNTQLNYYPLLQNGERFPVNDPDLKPRLQPKAKNEVDFFQGILEGISQIELAGYKKLHALGAPYPTQIISAGGGSKNTAWTKMREQMLNVSIKTAQYSEACYGSALLARRGFL